MVCLNHSFTLELVDIMVLFFMLVFTVPKADKGKINGNKLFDKEKLRQSEPQSIPLFNRRVLWAPTGGICQVHVRYSSPYLSNKTQPIAFRTNMGLEDQTSLEDLFQPEQTVALILEFYCNSNYIDQSTMCVDFR